MKNSRLNLCKLTHLRTVCTILQEVIHLVARILQLIKIFVLKDKFTLKIEVKT